MAVIEPRLRLREMRRVAMKENEVQVGCKLWVSKV
jgi:hypothetical protein